MSEHPVTDFLRDEVRHHLNCYHDAGKTAIITLVGGQPFETPFCSKCSMVILVTSKDGAHWRQED